MIYFGCWGPAGHYFYRPDGHCSSKEVRHKMAAEGIYPMIDGGFCPGSHQNPDGSTRRPERGPPQEEGVARLTHHNGWTILAFWDRTGDTRYGSNSNFIRGDLWDFKTMVAKAKETYPRLWERFTFEVKLYGPQPRRRF